MQSQANDPAQMLMGVMNAGQELMNKFGGETNPFVTATKQLVEMQKAYIEQMGTFLSSMQAMAAGQAAGSEAEKDKRFAGEAWSKDPRFDAIKKSYLAYSDFMENAVAQAPVDDKTKAKLQFGVRQFIDAMSPSNFFLSNPEAMQLAAETGGQSVVEGMKLFFEDMAKGRVVMSDEKAFEVGKNVAATPGQVIYENELIQLIQYTPATSQVYERPVVMVPPCINRFYILDLQPSNSLVRYTVEQGHTVFLLSWRSTTPELGHLTWDDYLQKGVLTALDVAQEITGADRVNPLGFCIGGAILACALGVLAAKGKEQASSLTLLTNMLDYFDTGELGMLISEQALSGREAQIGKGGILHGQELNQTFAALRANDLIWQYVSNSYLKGKAPPAFDMLYWNADAANLPGPMFCWYTRNTYLENNIRIPNKTVQCGVPVDLGKVTIPVYLYASREDHIVPWKTAYASRKIFPDTTFALGASGHIAGVINHPAKNKRNYWVNDASKTGDPDEWLAGADNVKGSWWPHWLNWLAQYSGKKVAAPARHGNDKYKPIEPAPGRYVKEKAV